MTNLPLVPNSNKIPQRIQLSSSDLSDGPFKPIDTTTPIADSAIGSSGSNGKCSDSGHVHPFPIQTTVTYTTGSISPGVTTTFSLTCSKRMNIDSVSCNGFGWVRLYTSSTAMAADSARAQNTIPNNTSGCVFQGQFTGSISQLSPAIVIQASNSDSPRTNTIWVSILNNNADSHTYTITILYQPVE